MISNFDLFIDSLLFKVYAIKCKVKDFFGYRFIKGWDSCMYRATLKNALESIKREKESRHHPTTAST